LYICSRYFSRNRDIGFSIVVVVVVVVVVAAAAAAADG
jgi:hypothetical protein